jgi:hypothetical protein
MMLKRRNLKQTEGQKCSSFNINNTATFKAVMKKVRVQSLNEYFNVSGEDFIWVDDSDYEPCSYCSFSGEKHPQFGVNKTDEQKKHQSEMIKMWWKNVSEDKKKLMRDNLSSAIKSQWDLLTPEERKVSRKWKPNPRKSKDNPMYGKRSASKGKIWITNGETNKMVNPNEISEGWYKGRVNVISNEGKKRLKDLTSERNRNGELGWTVRKETTTP